MPSDQNQQEIREQHSVDDYDDLDEYEETVTSKLASNGVAFRKLTNFAEVDLRDIYANVQYVFENYKRTKTKILGD